jgi:hypothetical protein
VNQRASDGAETLFTPSNPQLSDPPPDTVQGALDELRHTNARRFEITEDWINGLTGGASFWNSTVTTAGSVVVGGLNDPEHPGVVQPTVPAMAQPIPPVPWRRATLGLGTLSAAATPGGGPGTGTIMPRLRPGTTRTQEWVVRMLNVEVTPLPTYAVALGWMNALNANTLQGLPSISDGIAFVFDPAFPSPLNWHAVVSRSGAGQSLYDTGILATTIAWRNLRIEETDAGAEFYIDDAPVASIPIADPNYPLDVGAARMGAGQRIVATGTPAPLIGRGIIIDYFRARWSYSLGARS